MKLSNAASAGEPDASWPPRHAIGAFAGGLLANLMLAWFLPNVSWLWWNPVGFFVTIAVALVASRGRFELPEWSATAGQTQLLVGMFLLILMGLVVVF
jgi:hypothetical protein